MATHETKTSDAGDTVDSLLATGDAIGALCLAVEQSGRQMTLFGKPIDASGLRAAARLSVAYRLEQMAFTGHDPGDEDRSERVFCHEL